MFETADTLRLHPVAVRQNLILARKAGLVFRQRLVLDAKCLQRRKRLPRSRRLFGRQRVEVHLRKRSHGQSGSTVSGSRKPRSTR